MEIEGESLFFCLGCGVLVLDPHGEIIHANRRAESILGGREGWRCITPEGKIESPRESIYPRLLGGETLCAEVVSILRPDGATASVLLDGAPLEEHHGALRGAVLNFTDITALRREMDELRRGKRQVEEDKDRLDALVGSIDEIVFEFDAEGTYLNLWTANDALLKRPREELLGRRVDEFLEPELALPFLASLRRVAESGAPESLEYPLEVLGGKRWFLARIAPIPGNGTPRTLAFFARDITERKRMEEELRTSERRFHQFLEHITLAALILDPRGKIIYGNDFFFDLTGWRREEVKGKDWFEIFIPGNERRAARRRWVEAVCSGAFYGYHEETIVTRDGRKRLLGWNSIVIRNGSEEPLGCASIAEDITERRRAEEILRRSDQMKSEFISAAAHELRTPLTSIMGFSELLLKAEESGSASSQQRLEFAREIHEKSDLLSGIVNELLDLSRFESGAEMHLDLIPCRLDEILQEEVDHYRRIYPRHLIELSIEKACPPAILIDRRRMEEVMENLLTNAAKYSPPGRCIRVWGRPYNGGYLVSVADEGIGMTEEQVAHVFDKFYRADTSDTSLSGLGIGMSLVRNIVEAHGGRIWVDSVPMRGTTVHFYLPPTADAGSTSPSSGRSPDKRPPS